MNAEVNTWEDFLKVFHKDTDWNPHNEFGDISLYDVSEDVKRHIIASYKITKLIEVGYGGVITDDEWKNSRVVKYSIVSNVKDGTFAYTDTRRYEKNILSFHSWHDRERFVKYNKELCKDFLML